MDYSRQELMIAVVARLLGDCRHIACGVSSPIPGSAALLARLRSQGRTRVSILGSQKNNFFTNGAAELFDNAGEGRLDAFFLGGGQIDGCANINLVGAGGDYPQNDVRWPGSFGSAYLYFVVPKVILFREEHTRRVFVPKVDFISAPGVSEPDIYRPGGPKHLVTPLALFDFDAARARFALRSVHPGRSLEEVLDNTGFEFDRPAVVPVTPAPEPETLQALRATVRPQIAEIYPRFAQSAFGPH